MNKIGQLERQTQNSVVQLFQNQLNYRYLGNWQDRHNNRNIETDILKAFLQKRQDYSDTLISKGENIYKEMLKGKSTADFEKEVKEKFINEPAQMKLLIVVDKLLTGFDAPSATYLYLDKTMRDHSLFQAICRVNRLDGEDKEYGYIIDYKDLFKTIAQTVHDYTSQAFDQYETEEVAGLLSCQ